MKLILSLLSIIYLLFSLTQQFSLTIPLPPINYLFLLNCSSTYLYPSFLYLLSFCLPLVHLPYIQLILILHCINPFIQSYSCLSTPISIPHHSHLTLSFLSVWLDHDRILTTYYLLHHFYLLLRPLVVNISSVYHNFIPLVLSFNFLIILTHLFIRS